MTSRNRRNSNSGSGSASKRPAGFAHILPAPRGSEPYGDNSTSTSTDSVGLIPKRPRVGVPIACNYCRLKKTRCDGGKPSCVTCIKKKQICTYENPETKEAKNGDLLMEAVHLLNTLSPAQVTSSLLSLRNKTSASEMIESLRQTADEVAQEIPGEFHGSASSFRRDLEARYPCAYPLHTASVQLATDPKDHLRRLVTPRQPETMRHDSSHLVTPIEHASVNANEATVYRHASPLPPPPGPPRKYEALDKLDIAKWTSVDISDDFAAKVITLYLETDHPILSPFDTRLFLDALTGSGATSEAHCTPLLVNALLYWSCQMYTSVEIDATTKTESFRKEAEELLTREIKSSPTSTTMASTMFLSLGYLVQGKDHATIRHLTSAVAIGERLALFGVTEDVGTRIMNMMTAEERNAKAYPAWGVFNWIVLMGQFYRQKGIKYPDNPPVLPIPRADPTESEAFDADSSESPPVSGHIDTFRAVCQFWSIMHEVYLKYHEEGTVRLRQSVSMQFAEYKFRELLAWTAGLPLTLSQTANSPHHVFILHLWLHSAILNLFRPFLRGPSATPGAQRLRTFVAPDSTPNAVFDASVSQLKHLIVVYRSEYMASNYSMAWQTALLYTANAMLGSQDPDRMLYFLICIYSYQGLRQSFRVTEAIACALLSMGMQSGDISGAFAGRIYRDLRRRAPDEENNDDGEIRALFMADLERAMGDPDGAMTENLAARFEENVMIRDYTNVFDTEIDSMDMIF